MESEDIIDHVDLRRKFLNISGNLSQVSYVSKNENKCVRYFDILEWMSFCLKLLDFFSWKKFLPEKEDLQA